jgi:hypothetical protein
MHLSEAKYAAALERVREEGTEFPNLQHDVLNAAYPGLHQSALQVFHAAEERANEKLKN